MMFLPTGKQGFNQKKTGISPGTKSKKYGKQPTRKKMVANKRLVQSDDKSRGFTLIQRGIL